MACWAQASPAPAQKASFIHPLNFSLPYRDQDYAFLKCVIGTRSLVQLGESIHITEEFPRARLHLVKYLHERLRFDVLALEGSAVDAWLAMESLYGPGEPAKKVERAQDRAWFGLWQTQPMRDLMSYISSTQEKRPPLYLTSFDVQVGSSRAYNSSRDVFDELFTALRRYDPPPDQNEINRWKQALHPLDQTGNNSFPESEQQQTVALDAIAELDSWINKIAPQVARRRPGVHVAALRLIPDNLRDTVALFAAYRKGGNNRKVYQETRDQLNAGNAVRIRDNVSMTHKAILWAHHSHINHNSLGSNPKSMGQHLLLLVRDELYTIGLFAGGGSAMSIEDDQEPTPRTIVPADELGMEKLLKSVGVKNYFIDLTRIDSGGKEYAEWFSLVTSRLENKPGLRIVPAKDFHGAVYFEEVHSSVLLPSQSE